MHQSTDTIHARLLAAILFAVMLSGCQTPPAPAPSNTVIRDDDLGRAVILGQLTPVGSIVAYAGDILPSTRQALASQGWLVCDGQAINREAYSALYRVLAHIHGIGDGVRTFNLPDYRGLFLRGVSGQSQRDPDTLQRTPAATGGRSGNTVGSIQGDTVGLHQHSEVGQIPGDGLSWFATRSC